MDTKDGFTLMVTAELNSSTIKDGFCVFTGTKMDDAKNPLSTNDFKYSTWRRDGHCNASIHHQAKHWFDGKITIRYLKFLCFELYKDTKVGLIWDHAPQHISNEVNEYIKYLENLGLLVIMYVPKGLTSIMQVCDLVCNKLLKQFIKDEYYKWRREYLMVKRREIKTANNGTFLRQRIKLRVDTRSQITFIDNAIKKFNMNEVKADKQSIKDCFTKVGQNPWYDNDDDKFIDKLNELKDSAHFKRDVEALEEDMVDGNSHTLIGYNDADDKKFINFF